MTGLSGSAAACDERLGAGAYVGCEQRATGWPVSRVGRRSEGLGDVGLTPGRAAGRRAPAQGPARVQRWSI